MDVAITVEGSTHELQAEASVAVELSISCVTVAQADPLILPLLGPEATSGQRPSRPSLYHAHSDFMVITPKCPNSSLSPSGSRSLSLAVSLQQEPCGAHSPADRLHDHSTALPAMAMSSPSWPSTPPLTSDRLVEASLDDESFDSAEYCGGRTENRGRGGRLWTRPPRLSHGEQDDLRNPEWRGKTIMNSIFDTPSGSESSAQSVNGPRRNIPAAQCGRGEAGTSSRPRANPGQEKLPESGNGGQASNPVLGALKRRREGQIPDMMDGRSLAEPVFVSRRRQVTPEEIVQARNAAYHCAASLSSVSTTVVLQMRRSFVYRSFVLELPSRFVQRYMPEVNWDVTLVDLAWNGWFCTWNATQNCISGRGWRHFALDHCVEEGDALLMEILSDSDETLTVMVRIFRVVGIPDGLTGWEAHLCPGNSFEGRRNHGVPVTPIRHAPPRIQPRLRQRVAMTPTMCSHTSNAMGRRPVQDPLDYPEDSTTKSDSSVRQYR